MCRHALEADSEQMCQCSAKGNAVPVDHTAIHDDKAKIRVVLRGIVFNPVEVALQHAGLIAVVFGIFTGLLVICRRHAGRWQWIAVSEGVPGKNTEVRPYRLSIGWRAIGKGWGKPCESPEVHVPIKRTN